MNEKEASVITKRPNPQRSGGDRQVATTIPTELVERLDQLAAQLGWSRAQVIAEAIRRIVTN
ncbi:MAG: ribbon-helix-helix protein, CopG family [Acidimicrobiia bacterium]